MKAIILERRGELAALLREDGTFVQARVGGAVGETVELSEKAVAFPAKRRWMRSAVAALLALTVTGGTLGYMGGTASAYVSLDVDEDSAIELTINHFGRVIAVNALDGDTEELAKRLTSEVRHKKPKDALEHTMERLHDRGYFDGENGAVIVGVATDNEKRAMELREIAERSVEREGRAAYVSETSRAEREQAMERSVSAGRFGYERDCGAPFGAPPARPGEKPPREAPMQAAGAKRSEYP